MDIRLVVLVLVCSISLFCGALVVLSPTTAIKQKIPFMVTISSIIAWLVFLYLSNVQADTYSAALLINRLVYVGPILAIVAFSQLILHLVPERNILQWSRFALARYQPFMQGLAAVSIVIALSPYGVKGVIQQVDNAGDFVGYSLQAGPLYPVLGAILLGLGIITLIRFISAARHSDPYQHSSLILIMYGLLATISVASVSNLILPIIVGNSTFLNIVGTISPLFILFALTYTILWKKLLDVRTAVVRTAAYSLVTVAMSLLYIAPSVYILGIGIMGFPFVLSKFIFGVIFATFIALYFEHLKNWFNTLTSKIFFREAYDSAAVLGELNRLLVSTVELNSMLNSSAQLIAKNLKTDFCFFALNETVNTGKRTIGSVKSKLSQTDSSAIQKMMSSQNLSIVVTALVDREHSKFKTLLDKNDVGIVLGLSNATSKGTVMLGSLYVGYKRSGRPFNNQDVATLEAAADVLTIAIQNALHFEEIQNFNITLQHRVDERTRQLRRSNEKLKALDETKDDFISMASHQLRTPLTAVKGYLSMVLDGDSGKITPIQRKMLAQAFMSSQHMVYLIADLLNVSRLRTGKFVIEPAPINLSNLIQEEIGQLRETAASRSLELSFNHPKNFPTLLLDETKTRQVVMNFIDNALHYTQSGGHVSVELHDKPHTIELIVRDDGIGVPKAEQPHLFTKFYRAVNARRERPDGTGLGLFMAKKVIVAQGGAVLFDSKENVGSTFGFTLPKAQILPAKS